MNFKKITSLLVLSGFIVLTSCKKDPEPYVAEYDSTPYSLQYTNNTLPVTNLPSDNPLTIEKVELEECYFMKISFLKMAQ